MNTRMVDYVDMKIGDVYYYDDASNTKNVATCTIKAMEGVNFVAELHWFSNHRGKLVKSLVNIEPNGRRRYFWDAKDVFLCQIRNRKIL